MKAKLVNENLNENSLEKMETQLKWMKGKKPPYSKDEQQDWFADMEELEKDIKKAKSVKENVNERQKGRDSEGHRYGSKKSEYGKDGFRKMDFTDYGEPEENFRNTSMSKNFEAANAAKNLIDEIEVSELSHEMYDLVMTASNAIEELMDAIDAEQRK